MLFISSNGWIQRKPRIGPNGQGCLAGRKWAVFGHPLESLKMKCDEKGRSNLEIATIFCEYCRTLSHSLIRGPKSLAIPFKVSTAVATIFEENLCQLLLFPGKGVKKWCLFFLAFQRRRFVDFQVFQKPAPPAVDQRLRWDRVFRRGKSERRMSRFKFRQI